MNEDELSAITHYLDVFDIITEAALEVGIEPSRIAGLLLARAQQVYLADDECDLAGLERLLEFALENIRNRPQFPV